MPSKYGESRKNDSENKENKEANKLISPSKNVASNPLSVPDPCSSARSSVKLKASGVVEMCVDEEFRQPGRTFTTDDNGRRLRLASFRNSKSCRLCWCCCCNCSCAQARNHERNNILSGKNPVDPYYSLGTGEQTPTVEDIRSWGESFDRLMRSQGGRKLFRDFLKCEYSEENMLFWLACEDLKNESNPENVEEKARLIYEDYISILSPKEVSLDSRVRDIVNKNMIHPTHHTFDEAQMQIYTLMHRDSYPRFVNSAIYKKMAQITSASRKESIA